MPEAPTGVPERAERERESAADPDTKYQQLRDEEEAEREAIADDVADDPPSSTEEQ